MMKEVIKLLELPFDLPKVFQKVEIEQLTIERLSGEFRDYYYLTSPSLHQVFSYKGETSGETPLLLVEISLYDLQHALDNPGFKEKVKSFLGVESA